MALAPSFSRYIYTASLLMSTLVLHDALSGKELDQQTCLGVITWLPTAIGFAQNYETTVLDVASTLQHLFSPH